MAEKTKRLYLHLYAHQIDTAAGRYHFEDRKELFAQIYEQLIRRIDPVIYYEYNYPSRCFMTAAVTLGSGPDEMQDDFQANGQFSETYAVECLCMELLNQSYRSVREFVRREQRCNLDKMDFPEEEETGRLIRELQARWEDFPVRITDANAMLPSKTVVFRAKFGLQFGCSGGGSCASCQNPTCGYRNG